MGFSREESNSDVNWVIEMGCREISWSLLNWPGLGRFATDRILEIDDGDGDVPIVLSSFLEIPESLVSPLSGVSGGSGLGLFVN